MISKFDPLIEVEDDQFFIPQVGKWSEEKYRLLGTYMHHFTVSMHQKWDELVYIDLFAGAGYSQIKESKKILKSSSLLALSLPISFSKYIFCEKDPQRMSALKKRVQRDFPTKKVTFIEGDVNENIEQVYKSIPWYSKENTVLSFCFVDPYSLNLKFETIKSLGAYRQIDFLILLATGMDANRNLIYYIKKECQKIAHFIGDENWRKNYDKSQNFIRFLAKKYDQNMIDLGFVNPPKKHEIRSYNKKLPLYHLAFYSKHELGNTFWRNIKKYGKQQFELDFNSYTYE